MALCKLNMNLPCAVNLDKELKTTRMITSIIRAKFEFEKVANLGISGKKLDDMYS